MTEFADIYHFLQKTLDAVKESAHPTNKIAACLWHEDRADHDVIHTNYWPQIILDKIGVDIKIGNASGTVHAETACILNSDFPTDGASIAISDPFCPNCAKNMAEAGIKNIYIDENGFNKDFFKRRGDHFDRMSMQICERAGINIYALDTTNETFRDILVIPKNYKPAIDSPIEREKIQTPSEAIFQEIIANAMERHKRRKFSIAIVRDNNGNFWGLTARAHAVEGYSMQQPDEALDLLTPIGKYSFIQEPVNRMLMHCARKGYEIMEEYFFCSQVPTSREQVNIIGAGLNRISVGDTEKCRDRHGLDAMQTLNDHKILDFS